MNNDKIQGKAKEVAGKATGDADLESEGKAQHAVGGVKDKINEAVDGAGDKLKDVLKK